MAADNVSLGRFILDGIPPAPRGIPQIEVTFDIDVNGILNVTAVDKGTNKKQHITIQSSRLGEEEIERMRKEAEENEEADKKKKQLVEARNEADSLVYSTEKVLSDLGDKVGAEEKSKIEQKIGELKKAAEGEDIEAITKASEALTEDLHKLSARVYEQTEESGGQSTSEADNAESEETVDAEFEDKSGQA
jgi:molecular chaperone DnaK